MRYKKGDKVRVSYGDKVLTIDEYFETTDCYQAFDDEGCIHCSSHDEIIEHINPRSRKRKPVELWYRMVGK